MMMTSFNSGFGKRPMPKAVSKGHQKMALVKYHTVKGVRQVWTYVFLTLTEIPKNSTLKFNEQFYS